MSENKTAEKAENKPEITKEEMVTVRIPRERKDQEDKVVWINERRFVIKRGVPVEVPEDVASVLRHEDLMLEKQYEFEEKTQK